MFTGIIATTGRVRSGETRGGDVRLVIAVDPGFTDGVATGDSIAVSGACLTALDITAESFAADVSRETLRLTTLGQRPPGSRVNLEKSLTPSTPMGGHFVTGHVDGLGRFVRAEQDARSVRMRFELPESVRHLVAAKGSIAIEGISLTVNKVDAVACEVNIVPHTMERTTLGDLKPGDAVNIEADLLARYLARMAGVGALDVQWLKKQGFA